MSSIFDFLDTATQSASLRIGAAARAAAKQLAPETTVVGQALRASTIAAHYARHGARLGQLIRHFSARSVSRDFQGRRLLFVVHAPLWVDLAVNTGLVLAARGATVRIAWLPHLWARPAPSRLEATAELIVGTTYRAALPSLPDAAYGVGGIALNDEFAAPIDAATRGQIDSFAKRDVMYLVHREAVDCAGEDRALFEFRRSRLLNAYAKTASLLSRASFDTAIVPNGMILEHRAVLEACRQKGVRTLAFDFWDPPGSCLMNFDRPLFDGFEEEPWGVLPKQPDESTRSRVKANMARRESGKIQAHIPYPVAREKPSEIRSRLKLDERPVILLSPNVPYDSAFLGLPGAFSSLREWLVASLEHLCGRNDCLAVVRAHPAEKHLKAGESARDIIESLYDGKLPENLRFIGSDDDISTYSLLPCIRAGAVYSSTVGLELATRGIPAIVTTKIHYGGKGFTFDTLESDAYRATLDQAIAGNLSLAQAEVDLAWSYYDMFINRLPLPFPLHPFGADFWGWRARKSSLERLLLASDDPSQEVYRIFAEGKRNASQYAPIRRD